jgi:hypothetical protein
MFLPDNSHCKAYKQNSSQDFIPGCWLQFNLAVANSDGKFFKQLALIFLVTA